MRAATSRLVKTRFRSRKPTSGAKARPILEDLVARLKSCPSQNLCEAEFFSGLPGKARGKE
jgi:hypothetical protein